MATTASIKLSKKLGFKKVYVIDDAYEEIEPSDINGEDIARFAQVLQDNEEKLELIRSELAIPGLDPEIYSTIEAAVQNKKHLLKLWRLSEAEEWEWLDDALFSSCKEYISERIEELSGLNAELKHQKWEVERLARFDDSAINITTCQAIFLDFFLKGETLSDASFARAKRLGELIVQARKDGRLTAYPLVFLMSSRQGARAQQDEFKIKTELRADFFCFLDKSEFSENFDRHLLDKLESYEERQKLAMLLDEYWLAALRSAESSRRAIALLEPSELALLHEAELGVEEAALPDYLSWLLSEFVAAKILADSEVRRAAAETPSLFAHRPFAGAVPPTSRLADIYVNSLIRVDINDDIQETKSLKVNLGDVFARFQKGEREPDQLLLVIDQSCDLLRPGSKETVLCLRCKPIKLDDIALGFYRNAEYGGDKASDIVPIKIDTETYYYLANWELDNPETPKLTALVKRNGRQKRVGRYKPLRALARQASFTHKVSRIGEQVAPPNAIAYRATLVLHGKTPQASKEFDATRESWASVVIVQGRHLPFNNGSDSKTGNNPATLTKSADSKPKSTLSMTKDFESWLKLKLTTANLSDPQTSSSKSTLLQKIEAGELQRLPLKPHTQKKGNAGFSKEGLSKVTTPKLTISFGSKVPDEAKTEPMVLLLTPYVTALENLA